MKVPSETSEEVREKASTSTCESKVVSNLIGQHNPRESEVDTIKSSQRRRTTQVGRKMQQVEHPKPRLGNIRSVNMRPHLAEDELEDTLDCSWDGHVVQQ